MIQFPSINPSYPNNLCPGAAIKTEAWILRRLVSLFAQITRRPHVPRDQRLRELFKIVGIDFEQESGILENIGHPAEQDMNSKLALRDTEKTYSKQVNSLYRF